MLSNLRDGFDQNRRQVEPAALPVARQVLPFRAALRRFPEGPPISSRAGAVSLAIARAIAATRLTLCQRTKRRAG
jgi:hypothetical protein